MGSPERMRAVLRAAQLYFLDGMTQAAVADRLGCTRWTVGRLLKEGEERGIIDIRIRHPHARLHQLEMRLRDQLGLLDAHVVATQETRGATLALVAQTAADYLADIRPRPASIAMGWGRTMAAISRAAKTDWSPGTTVAQAHASPEVVDDLLGAGAVRVLAQRAPGRALTLSSTRRKHPTSSPRERTNDAATLAAAEASDVIVYSPGGIRDSSMLVHAGFLTAEALKDLWKRGARANVLSRLLDESGNVVCTDVDSRTPAVSLEAVKKMRTAIAVGVGEEKTAAFAAAIRGGLANVVITDQQTANRLLA